MLEQRTLPAIGRDAEMLIRQLRSYAPSRGAVEKPYLHQEWLINLFDCVRLFSQDRSQGIHPNRAALILFDNRQQQSPIDLIKAVLVHFQHLQRRFRRGFVDSASPPYLGKIPYTPQETIRNAWCPP